MKKEKEIKARVSESEKEMFERVCSDLGLSATAAVKIFVKAVIRQGGIPFPLETVRRGKEEEGGALF